MSVAETYRARRRKVRAFAQDLCSITRKSRLRSHSSDQLLHPENFHAAASGMEKLNNVCSAVGNLGNGFSVRFEENGLL